MRGPSPDTPAIAPIKRIAAETGLTLDTLRALVAAGALTSIRIGRPESRNPAVYLDRAEVAAWIDSRRTTGGRR